jgi:hypothetical protein
MTSPTQAEKFSPPASQRITRHLLAASAFLFVLCTPVHLCARQAGGAAREPWVTIRASANVVHVCPGDQSSARVRLKAVGEGASCAARYTWSATGGRVIGEGPEVVWDFNDARPDGRHYDITLTVEAEKGCRGPRLMSSAPARVAVWGGCPARAGVAAGRPGRARAAASPCPTISLCCRAATAPGLLTPFSVTLSHEAPGVAPRFRWEVSGGAVAEGQHTDSILVDTRGFKGRTFLTRLSVENYGPGCSATCTTEVTPEPLTLNASVRNARDGRPVPHAKISFFLGGQSAGESEADAGGRFTRGGLTPGRYRLVASADKFRKQESTLTLDQFSSGSVVISLNPAPDDPAPSAAASPSPQASPAETPTEEAVAAASPSPGPKTEPSPRPDRPPVTIKDWFLSPWAFALAALSMACAAAYLLLKGGAGAASVAGVGGAAQAADGAFATGAPKQSDKVYCTVFGPKSAPPGAKFITQVFAHLKEQEGELAALAARCVGDDAERFVSSKRMGREIARDTEIFFRLEMEGLEVRTPEQTLFWDGVIDSVTFDVKVPGDFKPGEVLSNVIFGVVNDEGERVTIGHVNFMFEVAAEAPVASLPGVATAVAAPPAVAEVGRPVQTLVEHKRAFISYASEDRDEVLKRVQGIKATGTECFMDKMTFKPGEDWRSAIYCLIESSDVFYLFWSRRARASEWVQREIDLALEQQRVVKVKPVILPLPLESTAIVPPPEKLKHMHFDDPMLDHLDAQRYRQSLQQPSPQQN